MLQRQLPEPPRCHLRDLVQQQLCMPCLRLLAPPLLLMMRQLPLFLPLLLILLLLLLLRMQLAPPAPPLLLSAWQLSARAPCAPAPTAGSGVKVVGEALIGYAPAVL